MESLKFQESGLMTGVVVCVRSPQPDMDSRYDDVDEVIVSQRTF